MPQDGPSTSGQDWNTPAAGANTPVEPQPSGGVPRWPASRARRPFMAQFAPARRGYVSATLFGVSAGVNVALLIGLIGVVLLSYAGVFPPGAARRLAPGSATSATSTQALASPTASLTPAPSPTASAGWLQISPDSVQLGCGDGQQSQTVVLQNTGPRRAAWQALFSGSSDNAGVSVSPQDGRLDAGASIEIQLQSTTQSNGQQGVIQFTPTSQAAGPPASLTYTAQGC